MTYQPLLIKYNPNMAFPEADTYSRVADEIIDVFNPRFVWDINGGYEQYERDIATWQSGTIAASTASKELWEDYHKAVEAGLTVNSTRDEFKAVFPHKSKASAAKVRRMLSHAPLAQATLIA